MNRIQNVTIFPAAYQDYHTIVVSGQYGLQRPLILITKGEPQGTAGEFIKYVLGEQGQQVVRALDFIPVR